MSVEQKEKVKISLSGVIADLDNGLDRKAIRAKYGLSATDATRLFSDPALKGRRIKTAPAFELIRDVEEAPKATATAVATAKPEEAPTATAKPKAAAKPKAVVETPKVEEEEQEEEQQQEQEQPSASNGAAIGEVATPDDDIETAEEKVASDKGVW